MAKRWPATWTFVQSRHAAGCPEFGANGGLSLRALKLLHPGRDLTGEVLARHRRLAPVDHGFAYRGDRNFPEPDLA